MNFASGDPTPNEAQPPDPSLRHLEAELRRLDFLLRRQIERWRRAGQDSGDAFRGLYVSDAEVAALLERPLGGSWTDLAGPDAPDSPAAFAALETQARALANAARAQGSPVRLERIAGFFELTRFDLDVLLLALAPCLDLRYQRIYGYLQDDITKKIPSVNLALDLFAVRSSRVALLERFTLEAPLFRHLLLAGLDLEEPPLQQALAIDAAIPAWLLGRFRPRNLCEPDPLGAEETADLQLPVYDPSLLIALTGRDRLARSRAAEALAARAGRPLLNIELKPDEPVRQTALSVRKGLRDARLLDAIPLLTGWKHALREDTPADGVLAELLDYPELVIVSSAAAWRTVGVARQRRIREIEFPIPTYCTRLDRWNQLLKDHPERETLELPHLAGQFALTTGQIRDACASACDAAAARGDAHVTPADLLAAARGHSNPRLGTLARKIEPRFGWEDIVLPGDQVKLLREIIDTVRQRPRVLDEWGVGAKLASSRGVTVLFAGPPGTGKTMAAEIMAAELGLDLFKIDLSSVVSKYIGETEKNLENIFEEAETSNAILFFDEADALFGKRSEVRDAHDRYANLEISYLLQRMEAYDGVTILATNLRANLDEAFTRRLQFAVDFPFPEQADRLRIWETLFPPDVPRDPDLDFAFLAERFKMAGGNIRNVIVNAAYLASADGGSVTMAHLLHGTRRELQKMGRLVDEENLAGNRTAGRSEDAGA
ncbi:MAG TPA: ATP-binding protein [Anaerolineales bacterium]|nr:ATP-binding protein [Anaerolineales bacterium]